MEHADAFRATPGGRLQEVCTIVKYLPLSGNHRVVAGPVGRDGNVRPDDVADALYGYVAIANGSLSHTQENIGSRLIFQIP